jgi:hypothetical protein
MAAMAGIPPSATENAFYDSLYRLDHTTSGGNTNQQYTYDVTGNVSSAVLL